MDEFGYYPSADGRPFREVPMPDRSTSAWRRPEAVSERTGAIDMSALFEKLDQLDRKASKRPAKAKRPLSWQAALVIVVTVLAITALVGYLAAVHVIPAL